VEEVKPREKRGKPITQVKRTAYWKRKKPQRKGKRKKIGNKRNRKIQKRQVILKGKTESSNGKNTTNSTNMDRNYKPLYPRRRRKNKKEGDKKGGGKGVWNIHQKKKQVTFFLKSNRKKGSKKTPKQKEGQGGLT